MAGLPDSIRPAVRALAKWHFWILAAIVPLLLLPAVYSAAGKLQTTIAAERSATDRAFDQAEQVTRKPDHPNAKWVEAIDARTASVRQDIIDQWTRFWTSQQALRTWPPELGDVFLGSIAEVEAGKRADLLQRDRQRYQNIVPELVRKLPARMGATDLMVAGEAGAGPVPGSLPRGDFSLPGAEGIGGPQATSREMLIWRAEDQQRLFNSFNWKDPPSTTQILLAQEELWIYAVFCNVIREMNADATGHFNAAITDIEELAVGYPAAEDAPGGQGTGRVRLRQSRDAVDGGLSGAEMPPPLEPGMEPTADGMGRGVVPQGRPPHTRFLQPGAVLPGRVPTAGLPLSGEGLEGIPGEQPVEMNPDDLLRGWIYVDLAGRPLTAAELASTPDAQIVHLVPFTLRVVMDQRQLDRFVREIVSQETIAGGLPIDVRQIRVNPPAETGGGRGNGGFDLGGGGFSALDQAAAATGMPGGDRRRPFDVVVELRGTVGLAVPPNKQVLEGGAAAEPEGGGA